MTVACPYCASRYLLPDHLMGPGGARVRCPGCRRTFVVPARAGPLAGVGGKSTVTGEPAPPPGGPAAPAPAPAHATVAPGTCGADPVRATAERDASGGEPPPAREEAPAAAAGIVRGASADDIARDVLGALAAREGPAIEAARAAGRLFAEFGPALFDAYDEYRRRAGRHAGAGPFRAELRERWGIELPEAPAEGPGQSA